MGIDEIVENFQYLDDWEDRYKYLIELGNALDPISDSDHNDNTKVNGCVSQVWITSENDGGDDPVMHFRGDSDAHIVSGLIAVTLAIFSGRKASEVVETDEIEYFNKIGLQEHITPQRSNGLRAMVQRIKESAARELL